MENHNDENMLYTEMETQIRTGGQQEEIRLLLSTLCMNPPRLIRTTSFSVFFLLKTSFRGISSLQPSAAARTSGYHALHPTRSPWTPISGGAYFIPTRATPIRSPVKRLYSYQRPLDEDNEEDFDPLHTSSILEAMKEDSPKLAFVGAGMMASALINGFIANKATEAEVITASDVYNKPALDRLSASGVRTAASNVQAVAGSRAVFLAVKPDAIPTVLQEINSHVSEDTLIVSIAMGVSVATLEQLAPGKRIVRVMPNTPCLVSEMAAAFCMGSLTTKEDKELIERLLGSVGYACEVKESKLDAVTGLSGSGPAYVYMMIEALADGGVRMGLPRSTALKLAAQTVKGAATMVLETETHPAVLKDQVCSPGGSTIAAVEALEQGGFRAAAIAAVVSATNKCIETRNEK